MNNERTPLPWSLGGKATIRSANVPRYIATLENNSERAANAEFIIRAVNSHDDLVAALKGCRGLVRALTGADDDIANAAIRYADAALAEAERVR
jgi:hypothetical protein